MGHRANYVIHQNGSAEIFYSHWGALHVLKDFFWGEEVALPMVRACEATPRLLDDVWSEGAALVDYDTKRLLLSSGSVPGGDRGAFLELFPLTWPGWAVEYATGGIAQIADAIGLDPAPLAQADPPAPAGLDAITPAAPAEEEYGALLTVAASGGWFDVATTGAPLEVLGAGPPLVRHVADWPGIDAAARIAKERPCGGAVLVPALGELHFWTGSEIWDAAGWLARHWTGWTVRQNPTDWRCHFTLTGRPVPPLPATWADDVIAELERVPFDGAAMLRSIVGHIKGDGPDGKVQVNAAATRHATPSPTDDRKREVIARVRRHLGLSG